MMKKLKRHCYALDLIDDIHLISIYKKHHQEVWPEITKSLLDSGIENAEIYCVGNRLFMILEVEDTFTFEKKEKMDIKNMLNIRKIRNDYHVYFMFIKYFK